LWYIMKWSSSCLVFLFIALYDFSVQECVPLIDTLSASRAWILCPNGNTYSGKICVWFQWWNLSPPGLYMSVIPVEFITEQQEWQIWIAGHRLLC
jgi:hypothetical protein